MTDLDDNAVREFGLAASPVDVKVCAMDEVWSGLKFVVGLRDTGAMADGVVGGAAHNRLAATLLSRAGPAVEVLEADSVVGGAYRTERPFTRAGRPRATAALKVTVV